ncbi:hypothetical protein NC652_010203 [Populus alba x Populus x berolinensis]|nr:hypothetical protein NC652_010203 [Populus alba x Populus x berolinensis]
MKAVHGKGEINECQAAKNYLHVVPTDCARRLHWAQQLCLGPLAFSTLRKPRKRTCRTNTNLALKRLLKVVEQIQIQALEQPLKMTDAIKISVSARPKHFGYNNHARSKDLGFGVATRPKTIGSLVVARLKALGFAVNCQTRVAFGKHDFIGGEGKEGGKEKPRSELLYGPPRHMHLATVSGVTRRIKSHPIR